MFNFFLVLLFSFCSLESKAQNKDRRHFANNQAGAGNPNNDWLLEANRLDETPDRLSTRRIIGDQLGANDEDFSGLRVSQGQNQPQNGKNTSKSIRQSSHLSCAFDGACCWSNQHGEQLHQYVVLNTPVNQQWAQRLFRGFSSIPDKPPFVSVAAKKSTPQKFAVLSSCPIQCQTGSALLNFDRWTSRDVEFYVCILDAESGYFTSCDQVPLTNSSRVEITIPGRSSAFSISLVSSNFQRYPGSTVVVDNIEYEAELCTEQHKQHQSTLDTSAAQDLFKGFDFMNPNFGIPDFIPKLENFLDINKIQEQILSRGRLLELRMIDREFDSELSNNQSLAFKKMKRTVEGFVEIAMARSNPFDELIKEGWNGQSYMVAQCNQAWYINVMEFRKGSTVGLMSLTPPEGVADTSGPTTRMKGVTQAPNRKRTRRQNAFAEFDLTPRQRIRQFIDRQDFRLEPLKSFFPSGLNGPLPPTTTTTPKPTTTTPSKEAQMLASNYKTPGLERFLQNGDLVSWDIGDLDWFCPQLQGDYELKCLDKPYNQCDDRFCSAFFANCRRCDDPKVLNMVKKYCPEDNSLAIGFCANVKLFCDDEN